MESKETVVSVLLDEELRFSLTCEICHDYFVDPVLSVACGHCFCSGCLATFAKTVTPNKRTCPKCRLPLDTNKLVRCFHLHAILGKVERRCARCDCLYAGSPEEHLKKCDSAPVCDGCSQRVADPAAHWTTCPEMLLCCGSFYVKRELLLQWDADSALQRHRRPEGECPERWIACSFGCGVPFKNGAIEEHRKGCRNAVACGTCGSVVRRNLASEDPLESHRDECPKWTVSCDKCPLDSVFQTERRSLTFHQSLVHPSEPIHVQGLKCISVDVQECSSDWENFAVLTYLFATFAASVSSFRIFQAVYVNRDTWSSVEYDAWNRKWVRGYLSQNACVGHESIDCVATFKHELRDGQWALVATFKGTDSSSFAVEGVLEKSERKDSVQLRDPAFTFPGSLRLATDPNARLTLQFSSLQPNTSSTALNLLLPIKV